MERIPAGRLMKPRCEIEQRRCGGWCRRGSNQCTHLVDIEAAEDDMLHEHRRGEASDACGDIGVDLVVAIGPDDEEVIEPRVSKQVAKHLHGRSVDQLHILDDENDRLRRQRGDDTHDRLEQAQDLT